MFVSKTCILTIKPGGKMGSNAPWIPPNPYQ
jgi:hypothetical protein